MLKYVETLRQSSMANIYEYRFIDDFRRHLDISFGDIVSPRLTKPEYFILLEQTHEYNFISKKKHLLLNWLYHYPDAPRMEYLPTFTYIYPNTWAQM